MDYKQTIKHAANKTRREIEAQGAAIANAARLLIGMVRVAERSEGGRSDYAELSLEVELTEGGVETWKITIERTASSH
jgi:hypothetical protein